MGDGMNLYSIRLYDVEYQVREAAQEQAPKWQIATPAGVSLRVRSKALEGIVQRVQEGLSHASPLGLVPARGLCRLCLRLR